MLRLNGEIWTNPRGERYVVIPEEDFAQVADLLEDKGLSRLLRKAKAADTNAPGLTLAQVKQRLSRRKRKSQVE